MDCILHPGGCADTSMRQPACTGRLSLTPAGCPPSPQQLVSRSDHAGQHCPPKIPLSGLPWTGLQGEPPVTACTQCLLVLLLQLWRAAVLKD